MRILTIELALIFMSALLHAQGNKSDIVLFMPFNGSCLDLSLAEHQTSIVGNEQWAQDRFGNACAAINLDGKSYVSISNSPSLTSPLSELTISAWVYIAAEGHTDSKYWVTLCCKGIKPDETESSPQYRLQISPITTSIGSGPIATRRYVHSMKANRWYNILMVLHNHEVSLFLDAVKVMSYAIGRDLVRNDDALHIGRDIPGADELFNGRIDDLYIYNRALNENEISRLYSFSLVSRKGNDSFCPDIEEVSTKPTSTSIYRVDTVYKEVVRVQRDTILRVKVVRDTVYQRELSIVRDTVRVFRADTIFHTAHTHDTVYIPDIKTIRDTQIVNTRDTIHIIRVDTLVEVLKEIVRDTIVVYTTSVDNEADEISIWNNSIAKQQEKLVLGQKLRIPNLNFIADSARIEEYSYDALLELSVFLKNNPSVVVEIGGHTNTKPDHNYCDKLSESRAKAVNDFMLEQGVNNRQLQYRGYGKRQPIAPNDLYSKALQRRNQRVEVKIIRISE